MGKAIMITSFKGGVGKTTVCAGLATALAAAGHSVIAIDMDFGTKGLDIALGMENSIGADILELMRGTSKTEGAPVPTERERLSFISAPVAFSVFDLISLSSGSADRLLRELKDMADYVLLDMPAGNSLFLSLFREETSIDRVIVVSTDNLNAMRAAEKTSIELASHGLKDIRLAVNSYRLDDPDANERSLTEIIRQVSTPIIGVIPREPLAEHAVWSGKTLFELKKSASSKALSNIAGRLAGEQVPLLSGIVRKRKRLKYL